MKIEIYKISKNYRKIETTFVVQIGLNDQIYRHRTYDGTYQTDHQYSSYLRQNLHGPHYHRRLRHLEINKLC